MKQEKRKTFTGTVYSRIHTYIHNFYYSYQKQSLTKKYFSRAFLVKNMRSFCAATFIAVIILQSHVTYARSKDVLLKYCLLKQIIFIFFQRVTKYSTYTIVNKMQL